MSNIIDNSQNKKSRLGRGLGSLLANSTPPELVPVNLETSEVRAAPQAIISPESMKSNQPLKLTSAINTQVQQESRVWNVAIDKLIPSEYQPRTYFDRKALEELAQSIKEKGIIQPLIVRKTKENKFEIIAGERRWRASQIAGIHEVPVIIKTISNKDTLEIAIIENIQREDLNPIEEAEAYQKLLQDFSLTQQQISEKVGKDRATVANSLRILTLPPQIRELIQTKKISLGHAKVLLALEDPQQVIQLGQKIVNESLSVRKTEKEILKLKAKTDVEIPEITDTAIQKSIDNITNNLQKTLSTKVSIDEKLGKGKITIQFYSLEELSDLSERIISGCTK